MGMPMAIGLVPNIGSNDPWGATYSGHWDMTIPIKPFCAIDFAQTPKAPVAEE